MTPTHAMGLLKLRQLAMDEEKEALRVVLNENARYRQALQFYAAPANYLDDAPMAPGFEVPDQGLTAREALRLIDYVGQPLTVVPTISIEEGNDENGQQGGRAAA